MVRTQDFQSCNGSSILLVSTKINLGYAPSDGL